MKRLALAALAACALVLLRPFGAAAADPDQEKLEGRWKIESFEYNGMPVDAMKDAVREFKDDKYSLTPTSGEVFSGTVKLDSTMKPKHVDLVLPDRTLKGIYEIDGETLKISYRLEGGERPTEFASKPDSGVVLAVHKRAK